MGALVSSADRPAHVVGSKSPQRAWSAEGAGEARRQSDLCERMHDRVVQPRRSGTSAKDERNVTQIARGQPRPCGEWMGRGHERALERGVDDLDTLDRGFVDRT